MSSETLLTIGLMALATIIARLGGLWLMKRVKMSSFTERWFRNLPGALLIAIVAPTVLNGSVAETVAALVVILMMIKTKNLLLAMCAGVATVFLVKNFLL